jgi:ribonuclease P protein component
MEEPETLHAATPLQAPQTLRKRKQFLACAKGRSMARGCVAIQILSRDDEQPQIGVGFTATRKIGGAVERNRAKRRLREAARQLLPLHGSPGHDYVFVARGGVGQRPWLRLLDDVKAALIGLAAGGNEPQKPRLSRSKPKPSTSSPQPRPPAALAP